MTDALFALLDAHALVDWHAIGYALANKDKLLAPLSREAITSFAERSLAAIESGSPGFEEIANLALDCPHTREDMLHRVSAICAELGPADEAIAARKWRAVELEWILQNLEADPVYALIQISTLWAKWGWPLDAPASMAPSDTKDSSGYGSDSYLQSVLQEHRAWLLAELSRLH